jgi:hypothetical protein
MRSKQFSFNAPLESIKHGHAHARAHQTTLSELLRTFLTTLSLIPYEHKHAPNRWCRVCAEMVLADNEDKCCQCSNYVIIDE